MAVGVTVGKGVGVTGSPDAWLARWLVGGLIGWLVLVGGGVLVKGMVLVAGIVASKASVVGENSVAVAVGNVG